VCKVLLVDNSSGLLSSVEQLLRDKHNIKVLKQKELSPEVIASFQKQTVDLIVVYIDSRGPIGLENLKGITEEHPNARVIIVSNNGDFAPSAYSMNIFDYLTLPITEARLNKSLLRLFNPTPNTSVQTSAR